MKPDWVGIFIYLLFFLMAVSSTFLPIRFIWFLYKIAELLCNLHGDECKDSLRKKYEPLGTDPEAYAKTHRSVIFIGRSIGIISLLFFVALFISMIH